MKDLRDAMPHSSHHALIAGRERTHRPLAGLSLLLALASSATAVLTGCGSNLATRAGAISVSWPGGATPGQLPLLSTAAVSMMPVNDRNNFGVDWTLTCGGNAQTGFVTTGCGTLVPTHTADGVPANYTAPGSFPVDNTVTITARVSSDPSQRSSVTITIVNLPVAVGFAAAPPGSLAEGATAVLRAVVANDVNAEGVTWSAACGAAPADACGGFSPAQTLSGEATTYTAPASVPPGGPVTITATSGADGSRSATATVTILPIAVAVSPQTFYVSTSGAASLTAVVADDVKNAGVTWSCVPAGCGTFSPGTTRSGVATTYTAPAAVPSGPVTITATSASDGTTSASATATVTTSPVITVAITSPPPSVAEGRTVTLRASVSGDTSDAGIDWAAACGAWTAGACGTFNPVNTAGGAATVYTAPAAIPPDNPVTITASAHAAALDPTLIANQGTTLATITAPPSVAFTEQPPAGIAVAAQATVSASVTNDTAPGGITWSVQCASTAAGACGYVQPHQTADDAPATYVAPPVPPAGPVEIVAASTAFPASTAQSVPVSVTPSAPHSVAFVPFAPAQLETDTTVMLNASVQNDASHAGVDWAVCPSGCGFFTVKPEVPAIPAVPPAPGDPGSPYVPPVPAVTETTVEGWPNGLPIAYTAPTAPPDGGPVVVTASATADRLNQLASPAGAVAAIAITSDPTGPALHGVVRAGDEPVAGASVFLYTAATSGYGAASAPVNSPAATALITTDAGGAFTIPGGYSCPNPSDEAYLVAIGGQVGAGDSNPNLALMTALGPCSNLASTPVVINEITSVASAAALATFSADNVQSGLTSYLYIGSSSANAGTGLANAFQSVHNLVDVTTGRPRYWTVAGNAQVPYVVLNTLADALNACAVTPGGTAGDGTACGSLFSSTNPLSTQFPAAAPTDTLQAVFDLLKAPSPNVQDGLVPAAVYALAGLSSPFQPILTSAPEQWTVTLSYTSGGGVGGSGSTGSGSTALAVDASGNLWITNANGNSVSEWSTLGAPISPAVLGGTAGGFTAGGVFAPSALAIDPEGYAWIVNGNGSLTRMDGTGAAYPGSPYTGGGLLPAANGIAIDGEGNVFVTSGGTPGSLASFNARGLALSPAAGYTDGIADPSVVAVDPADNVWVYNRQQPAGETGDHYVRLNGTDGTLTIGVVASFELGPPQLAIDGAGDLWSGGPASASSSGTQILEIPAGYLGPLGPQPVASSSTATTIGNPEGVAFDGSNRLWVANAGTTGAFAVSPNLTLYNGGVDYVDADLAAGAPSVAVDNAGNLWVLLADNTVKEFVGLATPVVTPLSVGVKTGRLGARP